MRAEQSSLSTSAERTRRYRQRKRQGIVAMVTVPVYCDDLPILEREGLLKTADEQDHEALAKAVDSIINAWMEARR